MTNAPSLQLKAPRVCAVVVTYFPESQLLERVLTAIAAQVDAIVIVNNTPPDAGTVVNACVVLNSHMIDLGGNRGIAAAHNIGSAWARTHGYDYVLLMDQDSVAAPDMVNRLIAAADQLTRNNIQFAGVGPHHKDLRSRRGSAATQILKYKVRFVACHSGRVDPLIYSDVLISSGSLIRLDVLERVGGFDESLFIDHVDNEWYLRARSLGYSTFLVCDALLQHRLGPARARYWFGRWRHIPGYSTSRHYYMLRNLILLRIRTYIPRAWLASEFFRLIPVLLMAVVLLPERSKRLALILRAIRDGLRKKGGPLNVT